MSLNMLEYVHGLCEASVTDCKQYIYSSEALQSFDIWS